jgi:hypothetical protein
MSATYTPLANTTLASAVTNVVFGSIPATYRDLVLVIQANRSVAGDLNIRLNADTGSNYARVIMGGNANTPGVATANGLSLLTISQSNDVSTTTNFMAVVNLMDYSQTDKQKTIISRVDSAATGNKLNVGRWSGTSAVTTITILTGNSDTFSIGTTFSLYGIIA